MASWVIVPTNRFPSLGTVLAARALGYATLVIDEHLDSGAALFATETIAANARSRTALKQLVPWMNTHEVAGVVAPYLTASFGLARTLAQLIGQTRHSFGLYSKTMQARLFDRNQVPQPRTIVGGVFPCLPFVLKAHAGASYWQTRVCTQRSDVEEWFDSYTLACRYYEDKPWIIDPTVKRGEYVCQEFIEGDYFVYTACGEYECIAAREVGPDWLTTRLVTMDSSGKVARRLVDIGRLATRLCSGPFSISNVDLIVERKTNHVYVLEVNPRLGVLDHEIALLRDGLDLDVAIVQWVVNGVVDWSQARVGPGLRQNVIAQRVPWGAWVAPRSLVGSLLVPMPVAQHPETDTDDQCYYVVQPVGGRQVEWMNTSSS